MTKQLKRILILVGILLTGFIVLMVLDNYYQWARVAILLYTFLLVIVVFIAEIFLQTSFGGIGPLSWLWVSAIRKDKSNLPEQKHAYVATAVIVIFILAFLI